MFMQNLLTAEPKSLNGSEGPFESFAYIKACAVIWEDEEQEEAVKTPNTHADLSPGVETHVLCC